MSSTNWLNESSDEEGCLSSLFTELEMAEGGERTNIKEKDDQGNNDDNPIDDVTPASDFSQPLPIQMDRSYEVSGSLHGFDYQKKFLMLFSIRSYKNHDKFFLTTEAKMAPKFDDIVLAVQNRKGRVLSHVVVQVKHVINNYRISANSLLSSSKNKKNYSLPIYLNGFMKFRKLFLREKYQNDLFIICTNSGFWYGTERNGFLLKKEIFEGVEFDDPVFGRNLVRFKKSFPERDKLVSLLLESIENSSKNNQEVSNENWGYLTVEEKSEEENLWISSMAKKLSEYILKNVSKGVVEIRDKNNKIYRNIEKLKSMNILEGRNRCFSFSRRFLECANIPDAAKGVRSQLIETLRDYAVDENALEGITFQIDPKLPISELPTEVDVEDFLSSLLFAVDQPNTTELEDIIMQELGSVIHKTDVTEHYELFDSRISQWMCSVNGKPLRKEDFDLIFQDLKDTIILRYGDFTIELPDRSV